MIIWLNGTFGVGKSTTASLLAERLDNTRMFDPEHVGYMLSANFGDVDFADFQELRPWRELVPSALKSVQDFTDSHIVAPQTVLIQSYWTELSAAIGQHQLQVLHVLLDCDEATLRARIDGDQVQGPSQWRHDHVSQYLEARSWMTAEADLVVDTTTLPPTDVVDAIARSLDL